MMPYCSLQIQKKSGSDRLVAQSRERKQFYIASETRPANPVWKVNIPTS